MLQPSKTFQFKESVCVCPVAPPPFPRPAYTHQNGAQDPQTAFSKSLLKMIVSVNQTAPLILIGLC